MTIHVDGTDTMMNHDLRFTPGHHLKALQPLMKEHIWLQVEDQRPM